MEDIKNSDMLISESINKIKEYKNTVFDTRTQFYHDLEEEVRKHSQFLHEVEIMPEIRISTFYLAIKRIMDVACSIIGLILFFPLFLVVAILIKVDSYGPIFFCQNRVGKNGKIFRMYKFRTMHANAEKNTGPVWASDDDPRCTLMGRILRKSKIDELPQFINLIKGEMSMVGPRPERPFFVEQFIQNVPGYSRRLDVTPGITGLAQLRNGYDKQAIDIIRKIQFDITYIKNISFFMDIRILVDTFMGLIKRSL